MSYQCSNLKIKKRLLRLLTFDYAFDSSLCNNSCHTINQRILWLTCRNPTDNEAIFVLLHLTLTPSSPDPEQLQGYNIRSIK